MLDRDTVIRHPHAATNLFDENGHVTETRTDDPRLSVQMYEENATLTLFFPVETGWSGDAPLLEVRITAPGDEAGGGLVLAAADGTGRPHRDRIAPNTGGSFQPWRLIPKLPLYVQYARAALAADRDEDVMAALRALKQINSGRRGMSDDFLRLVAQAFQQLVREGEPHPIKALALAQPVTISTASRWVKAARERGFIDG